MATKAQLFMVFLNNDNVDQSKELMQVFMKQIFPNTSKGCKWQSSIHGRSHFQFDVDLDGKVTHLSLLSQQKIPSDSETRFYLKLRCSFLGLFEDCIKCSSHFPFSVSSKKTAQNFAIMQNDDSSSTSQKNLLSINKILLFLKCFSGFFLKLASSKLACSK